MEHREKDAKVAEAAFQRRKKEEEGARKLYLAMEDTKVLQEKLRQCGQAAGVNRYEACRSLAKDYMKRIQTPWYGAFEEDSTEEDLSDEMETNVD